MGTSGGAAGPRPDWYPDPTDPNLIRYWDGSTWHAHALPKPAGWGVQPSAKRLPWWQTWWAVIPGLLLCLPFGLAGLWRRPAVSTWLRVGLTVATAVLYGAAFVPGDDTTPTTAAPASKAEGTRSSDGPTETPSDSPSSSATPASESVTTQTAATEPETTEPAATEAVVTEPVVTEPPRAVMPQVAGLTRDQAEEALANAGLVVREVRDVPSTQPPGTVLRQGKKVGVSVLAGSAIVLIVAAPYPQVPSVVGQAKAKAVAALQAAGFKVSVTTEVRSSGKDGVVLSQSPEGSALAKPGKTIAVVVSSLVRPVAPAQNCTSGYRPCLTPASDYDCGGGSGNGPEYAYGPIYITGSDPYDLDADGDGVACES